MSDQSPYAVFGIPVDMPRITWTKRTSTLNYYGPSESSLEVEGTDFLTRLTDGVEQEIQATIQAFLRATQNNCTGGAEEKSACWLAIRLTKPSTAFEVPRWHQDGAMYPYDEGREEVVRSKYGLTLLGPSTLVLEPDQDSYTIEREGEARFYWWREADAREPSEDEMDDADARLQEWLAQKFKDAPRTLIKHGEVIRFSWGRDDSPIHSEPDLTSDRIFMTVLYGSESELRRMCECRDVEYGKCYVE